MASIYDKALKRKDFSGIVDKEKEQDKKLADGEGGGGGESPGSSLSLSGEYSFLVVVA
jgi:hypothetical protein